MNNTYIEKSRIFKKYLSSSISPSIMKRTRERLLKMYGIIVPILEKEGIRFSLCGGTLLGAAINGKILPWDVDIDICILDSDYERALSSLKNNIPDWMMVQWTDTEKMYYHGWAKVRDRFTKVEPDTVCYENNGIWIDLYKLTPARKCEKEYLIIEEHLNYLNRRSYVGDISEEEKQRRIQDNDLLNKLLIEKRRIANNHDITNGYIVWSLPIIYLEETWCFPLKRISFEGIDTFAFNEYDHYLVSHYGENYKELPPIDQRRVGINNVFFKYPNR